MSDQTPTVEAPESTSPPETGGPGQSGRDGDLGGVAGAVAEAYQHVADEAQHGAGDGHDSAAAPSEPGASGRDTDLSARTDEAVAGAQQGISRLAEAAQEIFHGGESGPAGGADGTGRPDLQGGGSSEPEPGHLGDDRSAGLAATDALHDSTGEGGLSAPGGSGHLPNDSDTGRPDLADRSPDLGTSYRFAPGEGKADPSAPMPGDGTVGPKVEQPQLSPEQRALPFEDHTGSSSRELPHEQSVALGQELGRLYASNQGDSQRAKEIEGNLPTHPDKGTDGRLLSDSQIAAYNAAKDHLFKVDEGSAHISELSAKTRDHVEARIAAIGRDGGWDQRTWTKPGDAGASPQRAADGAAPPDRAQGGDKAPAQAMSREQVHAIAKELSDAYSRGDSAKAKAIEARLPAHPDVKQDGRLLSDVQHGVLDVARDRSEPGSPAHGQLSDRLNDHVNAQLDRISAHPSGPTDRPAASPVDPHGKTMPADTSGHVDPHGKTMPADTSGHVDAHGKTVPSGVSPLAVTHGGGDQRPAGGGSGSHGSEGTTHNADTPGGRAMTDVAIGADLGSSTMNDEATWKEKSEHIELGSSGGLHATGDANVKVGSVESSLTVGSRMGHDGLSTGLDAHEAANAIDEHLQGKVVLPGGDSAVGLDARGTAGIRADVYSGTHIDSKGISMGAGASGFAGAEIKGTATAERPGIVVGVTGSGYAGAGAEAGGMGSITKDHIGVHGGVGAALGAGTGLRVDVDINPKAALDGAAKQLGQVASYLGLERPTTFHGIEVHR